MKLNFRYGKRGPLAMAVWGGQVGEYAPLKQYSMVTLGCTDRLRWFDGVGWVCDHWAGQSGWKAPGRLGRYYFDDGRPGYQPQP